MSRRKKHSSYNLILLFIIILVGGYIAFDFYFNVYRHPQNKESSSEIASLPSTERQELPIAKEAPSVDLEKGFVLQTYRDERYGFEFKYPVFSEVDPQCPALVKTDDGLSIGIFSLIVNERKGEFSDFVVRQLEGMEIDDRLEISVGGKLAVKANYQTAGMNWPGSSVFVDNGKNYIEFGFLANESGDKCGSSENYEDRVYQSVISTLAFPG